MSPPKDTASSTASSHYQIPLPMELQWEVLEHAILNLFTSGEHSAWGQGVASVLQGNPALTKRVLLPLRKVHRALYWELDDLWVRQENGCEEAFIKRDRLVNIDGAIMSILEQVGADEDWAFVNDSCRTLTGYVFGVEKFLN